MYHDLLAYLVVLGHRPDLECLTSEQIRIGRQHLIGCLCRVREALEDDLRYKDILDVIKRREQLNGRLPHGDPELEKATKVCSAIVYHFMRSQMTDWDRSEAIGFMDNPLVAGLE